jgi:hypothetical protein
MSRFETIDDAFITTEPNETTMTELVSGIISDAQTLIRQQFAMLRVELKGEVQKTANAGRFIAVGAAFCGIAALMFAAGVVYLINWMVPNLPLWSCWMIVAAPIAVGGAALYAVGIKQFQQLTPLPEKSLNALQENLSWIANRQK